MDDLETIFRSNLDDSYDEASFPYRQMMTYYRCALREVETKFRVLDDQFSMYYDRNPIESIETRIKSQSSVLKKLKRRNLPLTLESMQNNLFDIAGIRVIGSFQDDIYMLSDLLIQQDDVHLIEKKDYIAHPKPNGYRSLHLIIEIPIFLANEKRWIPVEVQFRTIAMDLWATLEHKLRYKKNLSQERLDEIAQDLLDAAEICAQLDEKMTQLKLSEKKNPS